MTTALHTVSSRLGEAIVTLALVWNLHSVLYIRPELWMLLHVSLLSALLLPRHRIRRITSMCCKF